MLNLKSARREQSRDGLHSRGGVSESRTGRGETEASGSPRTASAHSLAEVIFRSPVSVICPPAPTEWTAPRPQSPQRPATRSRVHGSARDTHTPPCHTLSPPSPNIGSPSAPPAPPRLPPPASLRVATADGPPSPPGALECGDSNCSLWCPLALYSPVPRDSLSHMSFFPRLCHAGSLSVRRLNRSCSLSALVCILGLYSRPPPRAAGREWEPSSSRNQTW